MARLQGQSIDDSEMKDFLLDKIDKSNSDTNSFLEQYINSDFGLYAHKTNYLLPFSIASSKYSYWGERGIIDGSRTHDKNYETEFQISLKKTLFFNLLGFNETIEAAYTQKVWWQIYSHSAPFRETNYEPEIFITFPSSKNIDERSGHKGVRLGFVHESNGRAGLESRSWNRLYLDNRWQSGNLFTKLRVWHRISDGNKASTIDFSGDDNPDIEEYMGYGDLSFTYLYNQHKINLLVRNNLDFNGYNKGALALDWSLPTPHSKNSFYYIKLFSGYGESLIDYNRYVNKVAFGFSFSRGLF
jgi:phospholipase A1